MPASRPFAQPDDLRAVQALVQEVWRVAWYDDANGVGELEPVGTHPDDSRAGDDSYPVPRRLYRSVGFREPTRTVGFVRAGVVRPSA